MSFIINSVNNNTLLPMTTEANASVKKSGSGNVDAVKMQFAEIVKQPSTEKQEIITKDEKQFFSQMFPQATSAIQSYSSYSPAGTKKPVMLGSLIDVRG